MCPIIHSKLRNTLPLSLSMKEKEKDEEEASKLSFFLSFFPGHEYSTVVVGMSGTFLFVLEFLHLREHLDQTGMNMGSFGCDSFQEGINFVATQKTH